MFFPVDVLIPRRRMVNDPIDSLQTPKHFESAVDVEPPAFTLTKAGHQAVARVRRVAGVGLELRYLLDGSLRSSQIYKDWPALEQAANAKRAELLALGWSDQWSSDVVAQTWPQSHR